MIAHFKIKKMIEIQFSEMYEYCKNSSRSFLAQRGEIITDMKRTIESFNKTVKYQASLGSDLTKDNVALAAKRNLFDIYQALKTSVQ